MTKLYKYKLKVAGQMGEYEVRFKTKKGLEKYRASLKRQHPYFRQAGKTVYIGGRKRRKRRVRKARRR